jgi:hypothetical protein
MYFGFWFLAFHPPAAALTGTAVPDMTEAEVVAGGQTIVITLTGDTWIAA